MWHGAKLVKIANDGYGWWRRRKIMESVFSGIVLLQKKLYQYEKEDERKKEGERLMKAFPQPLQHSHLNMVEVSARLMILPCNLKDIG